MVQSPSLDGVLPYRADHGNAVGVELDVYHPVFDVEGLRDLAGVEKPWRENKVGIAQEQVGYVGNDNWRTPKIGLQNP